MSEHGNNTNAIPSQGLLFGENEVDDNDPPELTIGTSILPSSDCIRSLILNTCSYKNQTYFEPIVQLVFWKLYPKTNSCWEVTHIVSSDGEHYIHAIIAKRMERDFCKGRIMKGSLIRIKSYYCFEVNLLT